MTELVYGYEVGVYVLGTNVGTGAYDADGTNVGTCAYDADGVGNGVCHVTEVDGAKVGTGCCGSAAVGLVTVEVATAYDNVVGM